MTEKNTIGLDRAAYFSEEWYAKEQTHVFSKNWHFAGVINDVPKNGDYICFSIGRNPLFVIRDHQGDLQAFHNVCRHRGTVLLKGKGNISNAIVCGYHCWSYKLTGELRSIPQKSKQFAELDKSQYALHSAALRVFKGMIFVHSDAINPVDFNDWVGEFGQHFGPYDLAELEELHSVRYTANANWKLFIENHIESYHLWYAHKRSILGLNHEDQINYYYNGHWSFFQSTLDHGKMAEFEKYIPSQIIAPDEKWFGSGDHLLYPNLGVVTGGKFVAILNSIPLTPTTSSVEIRMFGKPLLDNEQDVGKYYEGAGSSEGFNVNQEDIELCERVQEGMRSDYGGVGALARDYEQSIKHYHNKYLSEMSV